MAFHFLSKAGFLSCTALMSGIAFSSPVFADPLEAPNYQGSGHLVLPTDAAIAPSAQEHEPLRITVPNISALQNAQPAPIAPVAIAPPAPVVETQKAASSANFFDRLASSIFSEDDTPPLAAVPSAAIVPIVTLPPVTTATATTAPTVAAPVYDAAADVTGQPLSVPPTFVLARPPGTVETAQAAPAAETNPPQNIYSPGVLIKKETVHLAQAPVEPGSVADIDHLAILTPAAGPDSAPPPTAAAPLIQLPATPIPDAAPPPTAPAAITQTDVAAPAATYPNSSTTDTANPLAASPQESLAPRSLPAIQPLITPAAEPHKERAKTEKKKPAPVSDDADDNASEPGRDLSPQSRQILQKIPSNLDNAHGKGKTLSIDRAASTRDVFDQDPNAAHHEAMGIKIEVKKPVENANYELSKAYDALSAGNTDTAIVTYKNVLEADPNNTNALFNLATLYHRAGQIDKARPLYARLLAINPQHREGLNNFLVLLTDEAPQEALTQLHELQQRNPDFSPIAAQMAIIYEKMGDLEKANGQMIRAIELSPENLTYRYNMAIMLDKQGKYDEAAKLYYQLVEAANRGDTIPGNLQKIQQRLTFISSNRP